MLLKRDLQVVRDPVRQGVGEQPGADLQVVLALLRERVREEVVEPAAAPRAALRRVVRIREAGSLREQVALLVVQLQPARPDHRVAELEPVIHVEGGVDLVAVVVEHLLRDVELVEVIRSVAAAVDGDVRNVRRVGDVGIRVQAPAAEVEILRGLAGGVVADLREVGSAEIAEEAGRRAARQRPRAGDVRPARREDVRHEAVAEDDELRRLDHVRGARRLQDEHARRVVVGDLHVDGRQVRRGATTGDERVRDRRRGVAARRELHRPGDAGADRAAGHDVEHEPCPRRRAQRPGELLRGILRRAVRRRVRQLRPERVAVRFGDREGASARRARRELSARRDEIREPDRDVLRIRGRGAEAEAPAVERQRPGVADRDRADCDRDRSVVGVLRCAWGAVDGHAALAGDVGLGERRAADGERGAVRARVEASRRVAIDRGGETLRDVCVGKAEQRSGVGRIDRVGDPREVQALLHRVVDGLDVDELRHVPVRAVESERQRGRRGRRAVRPRRDDAELRDAV